MNTDEIRRHLFSMQDIPYRDFQSKLIPTMDPRKMIGVRTPALRKFAKELAKESGLERGSKSGFEREPNSILSFLQDLPHSYFDEDQLHAFLISGIRDYDQCMEQLERFLPFVDNWATCDQMSPKVFQSHRAQLLEHIKEWIRSKHTYTVRFAIGMLMQHFLDEDFDPAYPILVASVRSEEYYINMMIAWYFATALAKQYERALPFLEEHRLDPWTHNKTIQKAVESYRITPEQKAYLRTLKMGR